MLAQDRYGNPALTTTMDTRALIDILKKNATEHTEAFKKAELAYKRAFSRAAEALHNASTLYLTDARKTAPSLKEICSLRAPVSHAQEYADMIQQLEMASSLQITLTQEMFRQYVLDRWEWKAEFQQTVASYGIEAGAS